MPGFVKTPEDEKIWLKAKEKYATQTKTPKDDWVTKDWEVVTKIFHDMKGTKESLGEDSMPRKIHELCLTLRD